MPTVTAQRFEILSEHVTKGVHNFWSGHTPKIMLSTTAPNLATMETKSDVTEISAGNGYTAGGASSSFSTSRSGNQVTVTLADVTFVASGGSISFRYAYAYNDTPTSPADPLLFVLDYGSTQTINDGESYLVDFGTVAYTVG